MEDEAVCSHQIAEFIIFFLSFLLLRFFTTRVQLFPYAEAKHGPHCQRLNWMQVSMFDVGKRRPRRHPHTAPLICLKGGEGNEYSVTHGSG